uniref:Putative ovule protein n=1 Tax=Solanum chacoense TaxID=4108 RepID=A0A0V0H629_SOLCH
MVIKQRNSRCLRGKSSHISVVKNRCLQNYVFGVTAIPYVLACTFLYHCYEWAKTSYSKAAQYHIKWLCVGSWLINSTFQEKVVLCKLLSEESKSSHLHS